MTDEMVESDYKRHEKDIGVQLASENSDFTGDSSADFSGNAKGNIGATPVPEPAGIALLTTGFSGLVGMRRRTAKR